MNIRKNIQLALLGAVLLLLCMPQIGLAANKSLVTADWLAKNFY